MLLFYIYQIVFGKYCLKIAYKYDTEAKVCLIKQKNFLLLFPFEITPSTRK